MEAVTSKTIAANELRIGNWVSYGDNKFKKVDFGVLIEIHQQSLATHNDYGIRIQPIPLTSEILEKCGFIKNDIDVYSTIEINDFEIQENENVFRFSVNDGEYNLGKEIKFVHQLQNLYFALTGEELNIDIKFSIP